MTQRTPEQESAYQEYLAAKRGHDRVETLRNAAPDMLAALKATRSLISEAAMTGFRWDEGDWAERLYANQATLSQAIKKAEGE